MIGYIEGKILISENNLIVIKTTSGVGYSVNVIESGSLKLLPEQFIKLHVYTNVREDEISLYGFLEIEQKELFKMIIKTSGIGPKLGLAVLSSLSPSQLINAVNENKTEIFSGVSGIGKKTAVKLCLDLKDQLKRNTSTNLRNSLSFNNENLEFKSNDENDSVFSALKNLGYHEKEINKVLKETGASGNAFEEELKKALSLLSKLN